MAGYPLIVYLHPFWQLLTIALGMYLILSALPKVDNPAFRVRTHERLGRVFLIFALAGAVFGKIIVAGLPPGTFAIPGHRFLAIVIVILVITGAIFGYQGGRLRLRTKTNMMRAHPWLILLAVALMIGQGLLAMGSKGLKLIRF